MKPTNHYIVRIFEDNEWSTSSFHVNFIYAQANCDVKLQAGTPAYVVYEGKIIYPKEEDKP